MGFVRLDFELDHLDFQGPNSISALWVRDKHHFTKLHPSDRHVKQTLDRYHEVRALMVSPDLFTQVFKGHWNSWIYTLLAAYLELNISMSMLMHSAKGKLNKNSVCYRERDVVNQVYDVLEVGSALFKKAIADYQGFLEVVRVG